MVLKYDIGITEAFMWYLYIIECKDRSLYTGITNSLEKRIAAHFSGKGAKYTKSHTPVRLVYTECLADKSSALKREAAVKKMSRSPKLELIGQCADEA